MKYNWNIFCVIEIYFCVKYFKSLEITLQLGLDSVQSGFKYYVSASIFSVSFYLPYTELSQYQYQT